MLVNNRISFRHFRRNPYQIGLSASRLLAYRYSPI
nr:MAG TPA: hypothetical protein [Bacteriophage sp.]